MTGKEKKEEPFSSFFFHHYFFFFGGGEGGGGEVLLLFTFPPPPPPIQGSVVTLTNGYIEEGSLEEKGKWLKGGRKGAAGLFFVVCTY